MNHMDQRIEGALDHVTLSQDAKYRIKNKLNAFPQKHKRVGKKLSSAAVIAVTLVSLLVITAAAIGGLTYFKAIYGDKAETLSPYGITIGTSVQNNDVVVTLQESVADEYATAYIFSIEGLTDAGKALVASNTLDANAYQTAFEQINTDKSVWPDNKYQDEMGNFIKPTVIPPEITDCKIFGLRQKNSSGDFVDYDIGLRYDNIAYNTVDDKTAYAIIPIESLREENCEYYALYVITSEAHQLTLTFNGLKLQLPEATTHIPGIEIKIDGYIQDYFLNEGGSFGIKANYPTSATLTPLGLYIDDNSFPLMYKNAALIFTNGSEVELSEITNDKANYVRWTPRCFSTSYSGTVYLFKDIMDISTVKSLVFYNDLELPFDGSVPFVRSTGRFIQKIDSRAVLRIIARQIQSYVKKECPDIWTVNISSPISDFSYKADGWSEVTCISDELLSFYRNDRNRKKDASFYVSLTDISSGTLEDEARSMVEKMNAKHRTCGYENDLTFSVTGKGTYNGTDVLVVECGQSQPGLYKRCIFALYEGKLLTIEYDGYTGQPDDYAFDALVQLIIFN